MGRKHPDTLTALGNLAWMLTELGETERAQAVRAEIERASQ